MPKNPKIVFQVNGIVCKVDECTPRNTTLNAYIRYTLALPGTKAMCKQGGCGACIVMVRARRSTSGAIESFSVNSCLVLVFSCNGWAITTIEGVGSRLTGYDDVQKRIAGFMGTQCGYCTPGFVMQMNSCFPFCVYVNNQNSDHDNAAETLQNGTSKCLKDKNLTMAELEKSFGSNTCRCTGFRPILDTMKSFASDASPKLRQQVQDIEDLSHKKENCFEKKCFKEKCQETCDIKDYVVVGNCLEQEINEFEDYVSLESTIAFNFGKSKFFKVYEENDIFDVLDKYGSDSYMFVDGNTGKGVLKNFVYPRVLIDISEVKSLKTYMMDQNLVLCANVSLEDCIRIFKETFQMYSEFTYLKEFVKHFELIAHIPVRKIGSLAGNLMLKYANPDYQSDVFLLLEAVGASVTIRNANGQKQCMCLHDFLKYDMHEKLMLCIALPPMGEDDVFRSYKIMPRNQNALAIVNAAFKFKISSCRSVQKARIVYGNISPDFIHARSTEQFLIGKDLFDKNVLNEAVRVLSEEVVPVDNPPEPSPECRKKLAIGLFYKFVLNIAPAGIVKDYYRSGSTLFDRPVSKGTQDFQTDPSLYPLNQPVQKLEAQIQSSGEAHYANDIPPSKYDVFGAFVLSTQSSGTVESIDMDILAVKGVLAIFTAKDIPGKNSFTFPGFQLQTDNEEILATQIKFYGQPIAILAAISEEIAASEAKRVKVKYSNASTALPVLQIDTAKRDSKRYVPGDSSIEPTGRGTDVKAIIRGVYEVGAQYHYYLEPISCVVVPVDKGLEVYDSTQWIDLTQVAVAQCLNMKESDVIVIVRRVGGGFGGKISRNVQAAAATAIVARKLNKTCRFVLPMETNMTIAGRRVPTQCDYEVAVNSDGKIQYLNATIVQNVGCSTNEDILSYVTEGFPNCYNAEYFNVKTAAVITDLPSNTFMRAPGTAEAISSIEHIMTHIAFVVNKDPTSVRLANMRTEDNDIPILIEYMKEKCDYEARYKEVQRFNNYNRWFKKSIIISVMSFPVVYYGNYSAFVSIYRGDGTVTVTTGGIEMGQGVNTKAAQVCAYELGIPLDYVSVIPHYSFTAANNVFSGSSITSESVCYSIIKACKTLRESLEPIKTEFPDATWKEIIAKAGDQQIDLSARYMMKDTEKDLSGYNAYAVGIVECVLDVLTGRFQIDRLDILEDVGVSANPMVDVGQVEGAYIQGIGYYTCEKLVYDTTTGKLISNDSLTYHVPEALDIPVEFNVHMRYNSKNDKGVLGSKTCGEMGICTTQGITHALRQCIMESRADSGHDREWINISIPYDTESILKALDVKLEEFIVSDSC